jgi:hydrogenase nickel incorporation protein HypA/HybF
MHEYSIVQALLEKVESEARSRRACAVRRLHVRIGEASGVEIDLLKTAYDVFRERTICEGADLDIRPVAARWECPRCLEEIPRGSILRCGNCASPARLAEGDEIILDRIEMEVADV